MPELIIGHTTHDAAKVWVRGDRRLRWARVILSAVDGHRHASEILALPSSRDYTGVATIRGLRANTDYDVVANFSHDAARLENGAIECEYGRLRSAPERGAAAPFSFLLGSCNLSTARLTALRELAAGYFGTSALRRSLARPTDAWYWPKSGVLRHLLRRLGPRAGWLLFSIAGKATRYQLAEPDFPSPFDALRAELAPAAAERPAFMIHAGDQIYFDIDFPQRKPCVTEYWRTYRQTWFEDPKAREFLAHCPHYMILDDHEIIDGFDNDAGSRELVARREAALEAYRHYVHSRQPDPPVEGGLFYEFEYGPAFFFVLDTRTERERQRNRMIGRAQMEALLAWLRRHPRELKFVVSSVPFVAQLSHAAGDGSDERRDKWCADEFKEQRDAIIDEVHRSRIERLVFLTGDMHCAYHATLRVGRPQDRLAIHELAGGPIHQVEFAPRRRFCDHHPDTTVGGVPFTSLLRSFHGSAPSVTRVSVVPGERPGLRWEVVRTTGRAGGENSEPRPPRGSIRFGEIQA
jgi:hypothetical protein